MGLIKMKKITSLLICMLFLMAIFPGITTATNTIRNDTSVAHSTMDFRADPALIKITDKDAVCDLGSDYVVYAEGSTLSLYNIKTGKTENIVIGGNIVYPKISEERVVYYDFVYMGFKMYDINTSEKTDLIVTNWPGGGSDAFQFFGDNLVYQNFSSDIYETELYLYRIASGDNIKLTNTPGENFPENPCIYNNIVAWQLTKGAQADIIMYNIENSQYTNVTHTSMFESDTYPTMYEHNIVYSYFYYDKPNGTRLYGLKMYNITTSEETTLLTNGEPTGSTPELYSNIIIYSVAGERLLLYNYTTNYTVTLYEGSFLTQPWNVNENYVLFTVLGDGVYLYKYNNPPAIEIGNITGGLFKVNAVIKNTGGAAASNVQWSIKLTGGLIILGKESTGTIPTLAAGATVNISSRLILGFGKTVMTVTADTATKSQNATVLFVFIKI
jgi:hypothetical protein